MQIRTLKLLANVNTENNDNNKVTVENNVLTNRDNNSWMFENNSSTSNNSQARICTLNYSSSSTSTSSTSTSSTPTYDQRTEHIWDYDIAQLHMEQEIVQCHDIAAAQEICMDFRHKVDTYLESDFRVNAFTADTLFPLARHIVDPHNTRSLTVLGWIDDIKIVNATMYTVHMQNNLSDFMKRCITLDVSG